MKKEAQKPPIKRCLDGSANCPPNSNKGREEQVKELLINATERRKEKAKIKNLLKQFRGRYDLVDLLPLVARKYLPTTMLVLLERIKNTWKSSTLAKQRRILAAVSELNGEEYVAQNPEKQQIVARFLGEFMDLASKA